SRRSPLTPTCCRCTPAAFWQACRTTSSGNRPATRSSATTWAPGAEFLFGVGAPVRALTGRPSRSPHLVPAPSPPDGAGFFLHRLPLATAVGARRFACRRYDRGDPHERLHRPTPRASAPDRLDHQPHHVLAGVRGEGPGARPGTAGSHPGRDRPTAR